MPIDPHSAFDIARVLFAGISATAAAIRIWRETRDNRRAAKSFDQTLQHESNSAETRLAAEELAAIMPLATLRALEARAELCWTGYDTVLHGKYLPYEIDSATDAVQACVCRELRRIHQLNGSIPPRWRAQWKQYDCEKRQ